MRTLCSALLCSLMAPACVAGVASDEEVGEHRETLTDSSNDTRLQAFRTPRSARLAAMRRCVCSAAAAPAFSSLRGSS